MKLGKEGAVPLDDTYVQHFDACLGCMACVTACPSGVRYDELIEAVRPRLEVRNYRAALADRLFREMIFQLFRTRPGCAPPPSVVRSTNARAVATCSSAAGCARCCRRGCGRSRS